MKTWHIIILALAAIIIVGIVARTVVARDIVKNPSKFAAKPDGSPDYTRYADGSPVMFG